MHCPVRLALHRQGLNLALSSDVVLPDSRADSIEIFLFFFLYRRFIWKEKKKCLEWYGKVDRCLAKSSALPA